MFAIPWVLGAKACMLVLCMGVYCTRSMIPRVEINKKVELRVLLGY